MPQLTHDYKNPLARTLKNVKVTHLINHFFITEKSLELSLAITFLFTKVYTKNPVVLTENNTVSN